MASLLAHLRHPLVKIPHLGIDIVYTTLYTIYAVSVSTVIFQGGTYWGTRWDLAILNCCTLTIQGNIIIGGDEPKIEFGRLPLTTTTL
jgi:hypothetical protein